MCGIAGKLLFHDGEGVPLGLLRRMADTLVHRGPDDEGYWAQGPIGLAHRRLSIIDPAGGRQPVESEDGAVRVVLNGEIYNHVELRRELTARGHTFRTASDTEVAVHLYEDDGPDLVARLRGMFALALWDARRRRLLLVRDRVGKKPLYYCELPGRGLVFASEIRALLADPKVPRALDPEAVGAYLSLLYVPAPLTALRGVRKLEPGHLLVAEGGRCRTCEYWDLRFAPEAAAREAESVVALREALDEAVRLRLRSDVPLGAFLSGGLDSSAVVASMAEAGEGPVITCAVGFAEPAHDERRWARLVAARLGCRHHEERLDPAAAALVPQVAAAFDEPFADPSAIPTWLLCRMARRHVKVALSGDGGDEAFAGYWRHATDRTERRLRTWLGPAGTRLLVALAALPPLRRRRAGLARLLLPPDLAYARKHAGLVFDEALRARLCSPGLREAARGHDPEERLRGFYARCASPDPLDRALYVDFKTYLPDDLLVKMDRASMAHGLEIRSPFLDHALLERAARLPARLKLRGRRTKVVLRRLLAGRLPRAVVERRKHGFTMPMGEWLRGSLRGLAEECLLGARARQRGLFEGAGVGDLWARHQRGESDEGERLWALVALELWQRDVLDAPAPPAWRIRPAGDRAAPAPG